MQTLYGRRRLDWFSRHQNGFQQELQKNSLVRQVHGKRYSCTPTAPGSAAAGECRWLPFLLLPAGDRRRLATAAERRWLLPFAAAMFCIECHRVPSMPSSDRSPSFAIDRHRLPSQAPSSWATAATPRSAAHAAAAGAR